MTISAIGLSGYARSGKTTAANYIEEHYGFERRHIAEPLREMLAVLLRWNRVPEDMIPRYLTGDLKEEMIPEIGRTSRELQISLGTGWGREQVSPDLWANTWMNSLPRGAKAMNDSVRFPNEEIAVKGDDNYGGFTILIRRRGTRPIAFKWGEFGKTLYRWFGCMWGVHDSERTDRLSPTYIIDNDGTLDDLHRQIDSIMALEGVRPITYARAS